jgi:hypothetical protein|tara:strand:+ start:683 stop:961 length:279 start_codon:yes stop_codon:yes gene_type:complete
MNKGVEKVNIKYVVLSVALAIGITATSVNHYNTKTIEKYKSGLESALQREKTFCAGEDVEGPGGIRLTTIICNGDQEICVCGDAEQSPWIKK